LAETPQRLRLVSRRLPGVHPERSCSKVPQAGVADLEQTFLFPDGRKKETAGLRDEFFNT